MKKAVFLGLSFIFINTTFAMCSWSGLWSYPTKNTIKANSWIILEGYGASQDIIDSLNKGYEVYLESDGEKIPLNVRYSNKGGFRLTQSVLTPSKKLVVGKTYYLKVNNTGKNEQSPLKRWNTKLKKYEPVSWRITKGMDTASPTFLKQPKMINTRTVHYGCGPAVYAMFNVPVMGQSEVHIKTQLVSIENKDTTTYFLNFSKPDTIEVGHGMCSGAFNFERKKTYKIRFMLFSASGNSDNKWSNWVLFNSPFVYIALSITILLLERYERHV